VISSTPSIIYGINVLADYPGMAIRRLEKITPEEAKAAWEEEAWQRLPFHSDKPVPQEYPLWFCYITHTKVCSECLHIHERAPFVRALGYTPNEALDAAIARLVEFFAQAGKGEFV